MKSMSTFTYEQRAVIARELAGRACAVELDSANATHFFLGHVPSPRSDRVPFLDDDLHCGGRLVKVKKW